MSYKVLKSGNDSGGYKIKNKSNPTCSPLKTLLKFVFCLGVEIDETIFPWQIPLSCKPTEHSDTLTLLSLTYTATPLESLLFQIFPFVTFLNLLFLFQKGRLIVDICKHNIFSVITDKFLKCLLHCKHVHLNRKHCFSQSLVTASQQIFQEGETSFFFLFERQIG